MDEKKENEAQAQLESSAENDPVGEKEAEVPDSKLLEDVKEEPESKTSNIASSASDDSPEMDSDAATDDEKKADEQPSEIEAASSQVEDSEQAAAAIEADAVDNSEPLAADDAPVDEDTHTPEQANQTDDDNQIAEVETEKPELPAEPESETQNLSDEAEIDTTEEAKDITAAQENSDDKKEDEASQETASDENTEPESPDTLSADESQGSLEASEEEKEEKFHPQDIQAEIDDFINEGQLIDPRQKKSIIKIAQATVLILALFSGFFFFDNKSKIKAVKSPISDSAAVKQLSSDPPNVEVSKIQSSESDTPYHAKINQLSLLRDTLLHKKEEILQLKKHYQEGIRELEKEIFDELRRAGVRTFSQAIENKRIEFDLQTIQRRQAYIRQLDRPVEWIYQASEELLYLKRRTMVDLQVAEIAAGIDMNKHMRRMDTAIQKYQPTADKLTVDMTTARFETLETIWQHVQTKSLQVAFNQVSSKNYVISEQICAGNFKRVTELSEISVESAKCIAEMQGSDLFLNDLTEISPSAAKYLFQWKGNWLCLNGFRALSANVASYLFQWQGDWISLNGLSEFPAEIAKILLQWEGKQLELMGLRYNDNSRAKIGIEYLAQWERSGGKLFVPEKVREKINALNRDPA
jgi:hypothetical protein